MTCKECKECEKEIRKMKDEIAEFKKGVKHILKEFVTKLA